MSKSASTPPPANARLERWRATLLPCPTWCDDDHRFDDPTHRWREHWGDPLAPLRSEAGGASFADDAHGFTFTTWLTRTDHHERGVRPWADAPTLHLEVEGLDDAGCSSGDFRRIAAWALERADELDRVNAAEH